MKRCNKRILLMVAVLLSTGGSALAQELNCKVQINTDQISGTDKAVYESFKNAVQAYMNTTRFTTLQLSNVEKIDCSLFFVFRSGSGASKTCELQVQSSRPVYGSNYTTTLLNAREELTFDYQENQPLNFSPTSVSDNLTATLNFWAYVILGMDFDSFTKLGGSLFFQKAQDICSMAQGSLGENWKAQVDRNHWGWITVLSNENQPEMRLLSYQYHRQGLDMLFENPDQGRAKVFESLSYLKAARQQKPGSPVLSNFLESKTEELINLYSKADAPEKQAAYDLLSSIYPAASNRLQAIKNKP
jgi:hypothetical protein